MSPRTFWLLSHLPPVALWCWVALAGPPVLPLDVALSGRFGDWTGRSEWLAVVGISSTTIVVVFDVVVLTYPRLPVWALGRIPYGGHWLQSPAHVALLRRRLVQEGFVVAGLSHLGLTGWAGLLVLAAELGVDDLGATVAVAATVAGFACAALAAWNVLVRYRPSRDSSGDPPGETTPLSRDVPRG